MFRRWLFPLVALAALGPAVGAQPAAPPPPDTRALTAALRDLLLKHLPEPLVATSRGWDHQKDVVVGMGWHKEGRFRGRAEVRKAPRNDGHWQKLRVDAIDPPATLDLGVRDVKNPQPGTTTFEAMVGMDVRLTYEQQVWKSGARLYGAETRARCRAAVRLACELTQRFEAKPGSLLPDAVVRVRVTEAELFYTDLVCEHTLGVDGPTAKAVGEAIHALVRKVKPTLERDLLDRANAAIVKAGDTKEVRIELRKLLPAP